MTTHESGGRERVFTAYLASLVTQENRAALAALRRGLGKQPGEAAEMFPYVMPWIGDEGWRGQDDYFLIASLFAVHQISWTPDEGKEGKEGKQEPTNLGASFRRLAADTESASIEKRFVALLNAEREDLPEHLRHAIMLLKAHEIPVDWSRLLQDLRWWDGERRSVQREWSRAFWREVPRQEPTANSR